MLIYMHCELYAFGSNPNGRKSHSGYLFTVCGGVISWASKKQCVAALSSTEAEYVAASLASQHVIWLRALIRDISSKETNGG